MGAPERRRNPGSETSATRDGATLEPSGFFALRTPLLPFTEFLGWGEGLEGPAALAAAGPAPAGDGLAALERALGADRARLRERLRERIARPEIREALFVASPSLHDGLEPWLREPDGERGQKVERALVRYFARMAGRATPFGLFAGCSVAPLGEATRLEVAERARYGRHTRLDMDYLFALTEALGRDPELRPGLLHRPNSSLYRAAGRWRYAEARLDGRARSYHLVAVEPTDYLEATLERARVGALPGDLARPLVDDEITLEEATAYVADLIDSQILVSDLSPPVTGEEPTSGLSATLRELPAGARLAAPLEKVQADLDALDRGGIGAAPDRYRGIAELLAELPAKAELPRLFQVDMVKPAPEARLGREVLAEIVRGVELLRGILTPQDEALARFRESFEQRYESREVPLCEALDEESGVGYGASDAPTAEASPLLRGLDFPAARSETRAAWGSRQVHLLRRVEEIYRESGRQSGRQLSLEPYDLEALRVEEAVPLPGAFAVMGVVAAASEEAVARGDFRIYLEGVTGPSGAKLLGRFCHGDEVLTGYVRAHLRAEEALRPDAIFAEIVHLPEGRVGNVLLRPLLRDFEIPYLGRGGAPPERQIALQDLWVSVREGRVVLRSKRLGREVVPRLTNAHNYAARSLGLYRFLCSLQHQGVAPYLGWGWGALDGAGFLPRVVSGRVVLALARWRLDGRELAPLGKARGAERFARVQALRAAWQLPRLLTVADGDNMLPIDLDNVLSVETFVHMVKDRGEARLVELWPEPEAMLARGPEGRFTHEIVVPFLRVPKARAEQAAGTSAAGATRPRSSETAAAQSGAAGRAPATRSFPPGSEWLYLKLYCGTWTADQILRDLVLPIATEALESGAADRWFFIRYGDPHWHVRLRCHGDPARLARKTLPQIQQAAASLLSNGHIWRLQLDTYEREVERYGGEVGIVFSEDLFFADSEAVAGIVALLEGDEGSDARWRLTLRGMDALLEDLGFDLEGRLDIIKHSRASFGKEFGVVGPFERQLGEKYRGERLALEGLLDPPPGVESPLEPGLVLLRQRSTIVRRVASSLRQAEAAGRLILPLRQIAASYLHMHANRLLRAAARAQELVIYDLLERLYTGRLARARQAARR